MRKYSIAILLFIGVLFINISGVNAVCSATTPWDCPGGVYNGSSGSSGSGSSNASDNCIDRCNKSEACKTSPNGQTCAQCKAQCQAEANEDKENWEDPTESFDSDATSNADDATGATSDEAADNTEQSQDISSALGYCFNLYWDDDAKKITDMDGYNACIKDATQNPDKYNDVAGNVNLDAIKNWVNKNGSEYSLDNVGDECSIISDGLSEILSSAFWLISIVGIILVVLMTAISFIKAIVGSDDEKFRNAFSHLITRIIVVIILLLLPMILTFIINLVNNSSQGEVKIGADGNIFCDITK